MDVKGFVADNMGHFSVYDIPGLLFVLVTATFLGYLVATIGGGERGTAARRLALWAATAALAAALVRSQLPIAAVMLAVAVLAGKRGAEHADITFVTMLIIGVGCGSGASVIVVMALIPFVLLMRWGLRAQAGK